MRWAINTAASRSTCTRCCRSSMALTRSVNACFSEASGSRDRGAPARAASRCQAKASARFSREWSSRVCALWAHSTAICSCDFWRFCSSSFSFSGLAAPRSRCDNSLNTSFINSTDGPLPSHSRMRAARSPEVGAENAPPVSASSGCGAEEVEGLVGMGVFTAAALDGVGDLRRGNSDIKQETQKKKRKGSIPCRHRASAYCRRCSRTHRKGHSRNEKPRWAEPTVADGGRNALAVGFGGESLMSPHPGSNRWRPWEPADRQTVLPPDASRNDRQTQVTPVRPLLQGFRPGATMWIFNHATTAHSPASNDPPRERKVSIARQTVKSGTRDWKPDPRWWCR